MPSTSPPLADFIGSSGTIGFDTALDATAQITTLPGSRIHANSEGSWVALVAPRVIHGGATYVNGSAAYVAMRAGSIRVDQGLFDIIVTTGTNQANAITHTGKHRRPVEHGRGR